MRRPKCAVNFANVANLKTHVQTCTSAMLGEVDIVQWDNPIGDVMANVGNIPVPVVNVEEVTLDTDNIPVTLEELTAPSTHYQYYNYD